MAKYEIDLGLDVSSDEEEPMVKSTVAVVTQKEGFVKQDNGYLCLACEGVFKNPFLFRQHWKVLHESTIELFQCPEESACRYKPKVSDIIQHLVDVHKVAKEDAKKVHIERTTRPNAKYISPKGMVNLPIKRKAESSPKVATKKSRVERKVIKPPNQLPADREGLSSLILSTREEITRLEVLEAKAKRALKKIETDELAALKKDLQEQKRINLSLAKELEVERQERTMAEKECDELKNELKSKAEESKKTKAEQFDKFMSAMKQAFDQ